MNADQVARDIYRETCLSPFEPKAGVAAEIAERLNLPTYLQTGARAEATLATFGGQRRIVLRRGLQPERAYFRIAEMVARAWLGDASTEALESAVAAAIVAPPYPFRNCVHQVGDDIGALSRSFAITGTTAARRLHEVTGRELVIWCKSRTPIRLCGGLLGRLPDAELEALTKKRTRAVRKVRLRADGAAVALMAS